MGWIYVLFAAIVEVFGLLAYDTRKTFGNGPAL